MNQGRTLAVDYGSRNVGLALSDELGVTIRPLPSIPNHGRRALIDRLKKIVGEHSVEIIVVGLPVNMDGTSGEAVPRTVKAMEDIRAHLNLPLAAIDERLTTVEALETWKSLSPRRRKHYRTVDSLAAALILRRYLDER